MLVGGGSHHRLLAQVNLLRATTHSARQMWSLKIGAWSVKTGSKPLFWAAMDIEVSFDRSVSHDSGLSWQVYFLAHTNSSLFNTVLPSYIFYTVKRLSHHQEYVLLSTYEPFLRTNGDMLFAKK